MLAENLKLPQTVALRKLHPDVSHFMRTFRVAETSIVPYPLNDEDSVVPHLTDREIPPLSDPNNPPSIHVS